MDLYELKKDFSLEVEMLYEMVSDLTKQLRETIVLKDDTQAMLEME
jgi:ATP-dependent RNA circularization protein (DNA/RNA ligase family)